MPNFSVLFLDIDGTTIGRDHFSLSPHNREALLAAKAAGVTLAMSTGRCLGIVPQQLFDVGFDYAITSNGAAVQDLRSNTCLFRECIPAHVAEVAYRIIRPHVSFIEWFANGEILLAREAYEQLGTKELPPWHTFYFSKGNTPVVESAEQYLADGAPGLEKIALVRFGREIIAPIHEGLKATGLFNLTDSIGRSLEVVPANSTKVVGMRALCRQLGTELSSCAACGDGNNDIEMLQAVGFSGAVANAKSELKAVASCQLPAFDEDGVAYFIENYVL